LNPVGHGTHSDVVWNLGQTEEANPSGKMRHPEDLLLIGRGHVAATYASISREDHDRSVFPKVQFRRQQGHRLECV
jgi:hypothetical protein